MKKLIILMMFLMMLVLPISFGEVIIQQLPITQNNGIVIESPIFTHIPLETEISIFFNVFNLSNGVLLTNSEVDCIIKIFNKVGLIYYNSNVFEQIDLNDSVFSEVGEYSRYLQCNSSSYGDFSELSFTVTRNGEVYNSEILAANNTFLTITFLGLAIIFLWMSTLFRGEEVKVRHLRRLFFFMSMAHLLIISLIIGSVTNCESGLCGDINRYSGVGEFYVFMMGAILIYVIYTYAAARITGVTENKK